jgi:hypothetical protein
MTDDYPKAPDLQELVEKHGGYDRITEEAWARFDHDMAEWHRARRIHTAGYVNDQQPAKRRKRVVAAARELHRRLEDADPILPRARGRAVS